jgi:hypothetical protein
MEEGTIMASHWIYSPCASISPKALIFYLAASPSLSKRPAQPSG